MKKLFGLLTVGAISASLAACDSGLDYREADLRWSDMAIAKDLNTATTSMATDLLILNNTGEGLIRRGLDGNEDVTTIDHINYIINDGLASEVVKHKDDETGHVTWTFTLREGIKWANGEAITAKDFEFGFQQLANPANAGGYSSMADIIVNGEEIRKGREGFELSDLGAKALENGKFEVTLVEEVPYFLSLMTFEVFQPIHKETWDKSNGRYGKTTEYMMSSGPYIVKDWDTEYGIYLEKNNNYWDAENVELNSISNRLLKEQSTALSSYNKGDLDRVGLTGSNYAANANSTEMNRIDTSTLYYLAPNLNSEYMADPYVREAISSSLDLSKAAIAMEPYSAASSFIQSGLVTIETEDGDIDYRDWNEDTIRYNTPNVKDLNAANAAYSQSAFKNESININFMAFNTDSWKNILNAVTNDMSQLAKVTANQKLMDGSDVYATYDKNNGYMAYVATADSLTADGKITVTNPDSASWDIGWYGWGPDYADPTTFLDILKGQDSHNIVGLDPFDENSAKVVSDGEGGYKVVYEQATSVGNYNRIVTMDGKTAAEASAIYDAYLTDANVELQAGNLEGYYDNLASAEAYLLDNNFIIPVVRKAGGYLLKPEFSGLQYHLYGSDYTWKDMTKS